MRLYFNNIMQEWVAVRHGYIIVVHTPSLDDCIAIAISFIQDEKKMQKLFVV